MVISDDSPIKSRWRVIIGCMTKADPALGPQPALAHCAIRPFAPNALSSAMSSIPTVIASKRVVTLDTQSLARTRAHIAQDEDHEGFYTINLPAIAAKCRLIQKLLPRVQPFYTMKCHPDERVFDLLTGMGCGVDCASKPEIAFALERGVAPDQIIYANTIKQASHLRYARAHDVALMTFDNVDELIKVHAEYPDAQLVLRILVDDSKSRHQLGVKFGAALDDIPAILATAQRLKLNLMGVCFHVGVGVLCASAFVDAIVRAKSVFDLAKAQGLELALLNLGGGFAGDDLGPVTLQDAAVAINTCLDELFPVSSGVRVISEPGRYFVSACATLTLNVIGRKVDPTLTAEAKVAQPEDDDQLLPPRYMYFVNDGAHGSFSAAHLFPLYDPIAITVNGQNVDVPTDENRGDFQGPVLVPCSLWGPTCDGKDFITKRTQLPVLSLGDWITFPHMGAYGFATGSTFNGFQLPGRIYVESDKSD